MEQKNVAILIAGFIALIIGLGLIGVIAQEEQLLVNTIPVTNETITLTPNCTAAGCASGAAYAAEGTEITLANAADARVDCPISGFVLYPNSSSGAALTVTTDYTVDLDTGILTTKNTTLFKVDTRTNTTNSSYVYCPADYIDGWAATVLDLVAGFFAIAMLLIAVGMFYQVLKGEGIINI